MEEGRNQEREERRGGEKEGKVGLDDFIGLGKATQELDNTMTDKGEMKLNDAGADAPVEIVAMVTDAGTKGVPPPAAAPLLLLRRTECESLCHTLTLT